MVQALAKTELVTFSEFAEWKPENQFYELHDGVIVEMPQQEESMRILLVF